MTLGDGWAQEHLAILGEHEVGEHEVQGYYRHGIQDATGRRRSRARQHTADEDVGVDHRDEHQPYLMR